MAYSKQTWIDDNAAYPVSAARMGVIEQGVFDAAATADQGHRILTTAQKTALGTVTTGTMVYDSTLAQLQTYNGSAWVGATGLVPIIPSGQTAPKVNFTTSAAVSLDSVFSSAYRAYRIIFSTSAASANSYLKINLRTGAGDDGGANYNLAEYYANTGSSSNVVGRTAQTKWDDWYWASGYPVSSLSMDVMYPNEARMTAATSLYAGHDSTNWVLRMHAMNINTSTQYTGISFTPNSGTITGSVIVYGYNEV